METQPKYTCVRCEQKEATVIPPNDGFGFPLYCPSCAAIIEAENILFSGNRCPECGNGFPEGNGTGGFCSQECEQSFFSVNANDDMPVYECDECGEPGASRAGGWCSDCMRRNSEPD